ncbi:NUDIX hydrolase [Nocardia arthritidis]|uniref:NUDIX domain-containing protein n=1 Tax=Nocardia arthritidis TaxID=228602 RepID=A0A6G9YAB6_9NOCA|nr:NUDIX domain-containing protein [Nocardia arthritidis]QIS10060.1 NUDIX domain-containing protein [Nocardia arthritidis]
MTMRWSVLGSRSLYRSDFVELRLADVELPDGLRFEHHVLHLASSAGVAIVRRDSVLMLWRHRFITDTWAWELPAGGIEPGETPAAAAAREAEEETGWRPFRLTELAYIQPIAGIADSEQYVFRADDAVRIGEPADPNEAERIAWVPLSGVPALIAARQIVAAATVVALLRLCLLTVRQEI